jgi:hypothetical protein
MDPAPSDGILREGLAERLPPYPGRLSPGYSDDRPGVVVGPAPPVVRRLLAFAVLTAVHFIVLTPLALSALPPAPRLSWGDYVIALCFFFPPFIFGPSLNPWHPEGWALTSLLWSATVYGLFLTGRWARTRLTRPSQIG